MTLTKIPKNNVNKVQLSKSNIWQGWLVFMLGVLMYANTIRHGYTQDDAIVIYDNMYTTQGIKGIKGLFTKDTFFGFFKEEGKAKLVSGGRYRPLTPAMFAIEWQIVGKNPWLGHLVNILLYGFLCFTIYKVLILLLTHKENSKRLQYMALTVALIYTAHPIHTEAVANIKGRDEIMSMLGSLLALYGVIKYVDTRQFYYMILAMISLFLGYLSKENTVTFMAVIPLSLYFFRDMSVGNSVKSTLYLLVPTVLFLMVRAAILGNDFGGTPMELMNNPFLKFVDGRYVPFSNGEKWATIIHTLSRYIQLLIFPHPLTHDYYPRHIEMMSLGHPRVLVDVLIYGVIFYVAIKGFAKRSLMSFGILYFLMTLSVVSNVVFPIGTNMSERFMFMPSLGFAIILGYLMVKYVYDLKGKNVLFIMLGALILLYGLKTFTRNQVWESDFRLFTTDVHTSKNSAKVLNAAGGSLIDKYSLDDDKELRQKKIKEALDYLDRAIEIHPTYKNAYLLQGNAHFFLQNYEEAVKSYDRALEMDSNFEDAKNNLAMALREAGKFAGEKENNLTKATYFLERAYKMAPQDMATVRLLGVLNGIKGNHSMAFQYFKMVAEAEPTNAHAFLDLSAAYRNLGDQLNADINFQKALSLDPHVMKRQ